MLNEVPDRAELVGVAAPTTDANIVRAVREHLDALAPVALESVGYNGCAKHARAGDLPRAYKRALAAVKAAESGGVTTATLERRWHVVAYLRCLLDFRRTHNANALLAAALDLQESATVEDVMVRELARRAEDGERPAAQARHDVIAAWRAVNQPA